MEEADVISMARAFVSKVDISNIREDLNPYISAIDAKVKFEAMEEGASGLTVTKPNGKHIIVVNSLESEERQRFTICHEIAHVVLNLKSSHEEIPSYSIAKRHPNEICCDTFAADLLMPYKQWLANLPSKDPSLEVIKQMAKFFKTSFPATASRFATLSPLPCAFVTMERGGVRYTARSASLRQVRAWISAGSVIPKGSIANKLRLVGKNAIETGEVPQDIWFENWEDGLDMWELSRHYAPTDTTISLLWFDHEDLPEKEFDRFGKQVVDDGGLAELTGVLEWSKRIKKR